MRKNTFRNPWIMIFLLVSLSLACSSQVSVFSTPQSPNVETLVADTVVALTQNAPTATNTIVPTVTSIPPSATPEPFGEVYVYTIADNINLRTNPGLLFTVSRVMSQNTRLRLLGQAPGGEWLSVMNDEGINGWVNKNIVQMAYDGPPPPVIQPANVLLVTGSVVTDYGIPVSGIGFAIQQGSRRTDAVTDESGQFYAYLPPTMSGTWTVGYVSVACTSNTMDADCNCIGDRCGTANPSSASVQLPQKDPLNFVWK